MSNNYQLRTLIITALFTLLLSGNVFAKSINLYDQPNKNAKVLGTIDISAGIVPIYSPKEGDWMKVGDPSNGNVGWVKSSDMNTPGAPTSFTFTQRFINNGKGPQSYQIIQYGQPQNLNSDQVKNMVQKLQVQQKAIQDSVQKAMSDMMQDMNGVFQWNTVPGVNNVPVIMPIVIMPAQQKAGQTNTSKAGTTPQATPASLPSGVSK